MNNQQFIIHKVKSLEGEILDCDIISNDSNILNDILSLCIGLVVIAKNNILISELDVIKEFFIKYFKFEKENIKNLICNIKNLISKEKLDLNQSILNIKEYCNYDEKIKIIHLLFAIASSDMPVSIKELDYIFDISQKIDIKAFDYNILKEHFIKEELDCYKILGVSKDATISEIKKAYRKAVSELHPDKKNAEDYDNEKFQQIVTAYNELLKIKKNEK